MVARYGLITLISNNSHKKGHFTASFSILQVSTPLTKERAIYARDALAKCIYERLFTWLVNKINDSLLSEGREKKTVLGLLDIYGFEIFEKNR